MFQVFLVLVAAASAVSAVVFIITRSSEADGFETQYAGASQKIVEAFQGIVEQKFGAISSMGVATIAHGVDHVRTWPRVTLSSFQQRAGTAKSVSGALFVSLSPNVGEQDRLEWEEYVVSDDSYWIGEGMEYQKELGLDQFSLKHNTSILSSQIFYFGENGTKVTDPGPAPYLAVWETSPILQRAFVNQNIFRENPYFEGSHAFECLESGQVIIGGFKTAPVGNSSHSNALTSFFASLLSIDAEKNVEYQGDPMSNVFMPIFSSFQPDRKTVAVLTSTFNWASFWKNVLPPTNEGVVVVLDNGCDESFTYEVNGEDVVLIGPGTCENLPVNSFTLLLKIPSFKRCCT